MPTIHFNGKTYNDIAEMPATERQAYEQLTTMFRDENQDGIPDIFQGDVVGNLLKAVTTTVIVDGKQVSGLDNMSPEMRAKFEQGLSKLQELGLISQLPDLSGSGEPSWVDANIRPSRPIIQSPSAIQDDRSNSRWLVAILVMLALLICGFGAAFFLFMRQGM